MRSLFRLLACLGFLLAAAPAAAAPTCQDRHGATIKCGTEGAMPVGWALPLEERAAFEAANPQPPQGNDGFRAFLIVAALLGMFALLPDFDGRRDEDWGEQENDRKRRR